MNNFKVGDRVKFIGGNPSTDNACDNYWSKEANLRKNKIYVVEKSNNPKRNTIKVIGGQNYWINSRQFELVQEVKQNREEIMNKKQNFSIAGSKALKRAFAEEVKLPLYSEQSLDSNLTSLVKTEFKGFQGDAVLVSSNKIIFNLPEDWTEALEYVKEYFEEEPKFKKGDYVISLEDTAYGRKKGDLLKLKKGDEYIIVKTNSNERFDEDISDYSIYSTLRLATPEEIKAAQTKTLVVGNTKIKVTISKDRIEAEGRELSIDLLEEVLEYMDIDLYFDNDDTDWDIKCASIKIGCCTLSLDEVKLIKKTYEELND